jgi:RNA polymerase sigma-70 factor (ECF subfamily)
MSLARPAHRPALVPTHDQGGPLDIASLYRTYSAKVGRWAARLGGPSIEVEDVVQEVFLVAKRRLSSFRPDGGKITTWLFRTTERVVKTARRKHRVRALFGRFLADLPPTTATGPDVPGDELERRQEIERVYRVLDRLPERQRRVLILFELEGLSTQEIATLTGARVGTVRVWLFRARASFMEHHDLVSAGEGKPRQAKPLEDKPR